MPATHPYIPRIGMVFDFDKTLASDTIDALCVVWGIGRDEWERTYLDPLGGSWDGVLRRGHALIRCGRDRGRPLSKTLFEEAAERIRLFPGVRDLPERLTDAVRQVRREAEVEMVVLSSGFAEMIDRTDVGSLFGRVWAGSFHFEDGEAVAVKRIISHAEKARYIEAYSKGLDLDAANEPQTQDPDFDEHERHIPPDQIVYVGDGLSDLKAFAFVANNGGMAVAIDRTHQFDHQDRQMPSQRVDNVAEPDYGQDSELLSTLCHAARSAASRIAVRAFSRDE